MTTDELHEGAMRKIVQKMDADRVLDYCEMVNGMSRRQLLTALDWDNCKHNTERLRVEARRRILANDPIFDIWLGMNAK